MIRVQCNTCKSVLRVPDEKAGARGRCPVCGGPVAVPRPVAEARPSPGEEPARRDPIPLADEAPGPRSPYAAAPAPVRAPVAGGKQCPSCSVALPANAKICVQCGIRIPSGRPLLTVREVDEDILEIRADQIIRKVSWLVPSGLIPIYSEAMGKSRPYATWAIAAVTIAVSVYAWFDPHFERNGMLWPPRSESAVAEKEARTPRAPSPANRSSDANSAAEDPNSEEEEKEVSIEDLMRALFPMERGTYHTYQLVSHQFLHAGIMHLAGNLVFLLVLGSRVNARIGNIAMVPVYLLLGVAAGLAQMWSSSGDPRPSLGASGAIMGLAGIYAIFFPAQRVYMAGWIRWGLFAGFHLSKKVFAARGILMVLFFISFDVIYTILQVQTGTAHWAHLGGIIAGATLALLLLISRVLYCPGDFLSLALGRFAWPLIGSPAKRLK